MNDRIDAIKHKHTANRLHGFIVGSIRLETYGDLAELVSGAFTAGVNAAQDDAIIERQIAMDAERLRQNPSPILPWPETGAIIDGIRETVKAAQGEAGV